MPMALYRKIRRAMTLRNCQSIELRKFMLVIVLVIALIVIITIIVFLRENTSRELIIIQQQESLTKSKLVGILPFAPVSKDLIIHRVYFDDRKKTSGHDNQTVFFIDANWTIFKNNGIVGCGVSDRTADKFVIRIPAEWYWIRGYRRKVPFKYEHLYVDCYDLPAKHGDRAFLLYKTTNDTFGTVYIVESETPVIFPKPRQPSLNNNSSYNHTIVSCIKANSKIAPFLGEILHYQKSIGVDHVSLITLSSFIKDGGLKHLLLKYPHIIEYFIKEYITVDVWKEWYNETDEAHEIRLWSESIRKVACSYNYRGTYDYAMPIDTDDFFTPRIPKQTNIKYYLDKYCFKESKIGSCMLNWLNYYLECGLNEIPSNGNVTNALKSFEYCLDPRARKSIHKTTALIDATFHDAMQHSENPHPPLMPGYKVDPKAIPPHICSISHLRKNCKRHITNCSPPASCCTKRFQQTAAWSNSSFQPHLHSDYPMSA